MELTKREVTILRNLVTAKINQCKDEILLYKSPERKQLYAEQIAELESLRNKLGIEVEKLSVRKPGDEKHVDQKPR